MSNGGWFKPGDDARRATGRRNGAKLKLTAKFLEELAEDFEQNGKAAIVAARTEDPGRYLSIVAALVPKEVEVSRPLEELSDDELTAALDYVRQRLAEVAEDVGARDANPEGAPSAH